MKTLFLTKFQHRETVLYNLVKVMIIFGYAIFAYTRIFLVVKKLARSSITPCSPVDKSKTTRRKLLIQQVKHAKSCLVAVSCFFVLYTIPSFVHFIFMIHVQTGDLFLIRTWAQTLAFTNSLLNSIIFFWSKTMLREEALKLLKTIK